MKSVVATVLTAALMALPASAQVQGLKIQNGDIYLPTGQLTHDGHVGEAVMSNDHQLIAYVRNGPAQSSSSRNDIYVCIVAQRACALAVQGRETTENETNLGDIAGPVFSLQAGAGPNGTLNGSIFFLSQAGGSRVLGLHRLVLQGKTIQQVANAPVSFVTYASDLEVIQSGRYAGALKIKNSQIVEGKGRCFADVIFDPNAHRILQQGPYNQCGD